MFEYRLSTKEIALLNLICKKKTTIRELSDQIALSYSRTSELVTTLKQKGFVTKSKGLKKTIKRSKNEHTQKYCSLTNTFPHIDWKQNLSHSKAEILTQTCYEQTSINTLAKITNKTKKTIRNNIKKPMEIGIIKQQNKELKTTERFSPLCSFLKSWRYYYDLSLVEKTAPDSTIIEQAGLEFIIESESPIKSKHFTETGPSYLTKIDDHLLYTSYTYIHTHREISLKEHLINTIKLTSDKRIYNTTKRIAEENNIPMEDIS
ncbi:MAG: helix-turn-helix domain-containing protein [Thermoplasmata archaeon]